MISLRRSGEFGMPVPGSAAEASAGGASSITAFARGPPQASANLSDRQNRDGETAVDHSLFLEKNHPVGRLVGRGRTANA
jgi:hypothetical protein